MPITWEGIRGIYFKDNTQKKISKKVARQQRARKACALRFGWSSEDYDKAINGEIAYADYGMIYLENYLHGIDEPVLLEQDVVPFNLPHINQIATAAWGRDIDEIDRSLSEVPQKIRDDAFLLAQYNYNIHWQYNNPPGDTFPDYLGEFLDDEANAQQPFTEKATAFVEFLDMLNLANNEEDIAEIREKHESVKAYCNQNGWCAEEIGLKMRGIDARHQLIYAVSKNK